MSAGTSGGHNGVCPPLVLPMIAPELELQAVVSCLRMMVETELCKTVYGLNAEPAL